MSAGRLLCSLAAVAKVAPRLSCARTASRPTSDEVGAPRNRRRDQRVLGQRRPNLRSRKAEDYRSRTSGPWRFASWRWRFVTPEGREIGACPKESAQLNDLTSHHLTNWIGVVPGGAWDDNESSAHRPQSSSASRFTAAGSGFFILSQSGERPER